MIDTRHEELRSERPPGSFDVIIPVKDLEAHLNACLLLLVPQLGADDQVWVVDDASHLPLKIAVADDRVHLIRNSDSVGPYQARNLVGNRSGAACLLFVDARSRPYPGLLDAHRGVLRDAGVAISCTGVEVLPGSSMASKVAAAQDLFRLSAYVGVPGRLDYFPTANLGVTRAAFRGVAGFEVVRSGADADLCWRIQTGGYGSLRAEPSILMGWEPRERLIDLIEQLFRYGRSGALLRQRNEEPAAHHGRLRGKFGTLSRLVSLCHEDPTKLPAALLSLSLHAVYVSGYLEGRVRARLKTGRAASL